MDKILQSTSGDVQVTNDGATILKSIHIDNAAAKVRGSTVHYSVCPVLYLLSCVHGRLRPCMVVDWTRCCVRAFFVVLALFWWAWL